MPTAGHMVLFAGLLVGTILAVVIAKLQEERPHTHDRLPPRRDTATDSNRVSNSESPQCTICKGGLNNNTPLTTAQCCGGTFHRECHDAYRSVLITVRGYYMCQRCQTRRTS